MLNKAVDNVSSDVEQPTTNLSPDMPNDPVVQSNKDLALNEQPDGAAVESNSNDGVSETVVVMVCRSWDVHVVTGRYLRMDFVFSDAKGNAIHCTANANIAHNFLKLKEGSVYLIRYFVVHQNKEEYRIFRDHAVILEFDRATLARETSVTGGGFVRYPFELQDLGNIELTNNKYLIDVAGYVTNVGRTTYQKTGSRTLDFYLTNGSSSSTQILDDPHIPALKEFKKGISDGEGALDQVTVNVDHSQPKDGTLKNLLIWARNRKNDSSTFNCKVRIDNVRTRKGWNYPSYGGSKCKKGIDRKAGSFWCDLCNKPVEYPVLRFRLELDISDQTTSTVVVMFDDIATELVKCSADSIMQTEDETADVHAILPQALQNMIGTTHILELKSHTYYVQCTFESFTCRRIVPEEAVEESVGSSNIDEKVPAKRKRMKSLAMHTSVTTPSKPVEDKKKKRVELEDSKEEMASAWNGAQENAKDGSGSEKKKKRSFEPIMQNESLNRQTSNSPLSTILHNAFSIHTNTVITRDGKVQSYSGLKLTNIATPASGTRHLPHNTNVRQKQKVTASTSNHPLNNSEMRTSEQARVRASRKIPKRAALTSAGVYVSYHNLGPPLYQCRNCNAYMWYEERNNQGNRAVNPTFPYVAKKVNCCYQNSKTHLPH
ncbi:replication protein A 70 kDa DNA-binding subunit C-like protein [Tanacetum coccineum]